MDWARQVIRGGERNTELARSYAEMADHVAEVRESESRFFADFLKDWSHTGSHDTDIVLVEEIAGRILVPAAKAAPILLLLMDGMSHAVFRELVADIASREWFEITPEGTERRVIGLSAFPSVTEVCRTSLLTGSLRRGHANDEIRGFAEHDGLRSVRANALPPCLFHKAALESDEDTSLSGEIRHALASERQRVVGIVINAVDDHLEKGELSDPRWTTQYIRVLEPILAEACSAGRLVLLLSDHGHVLNRQTAYHACEDGERWRRPDSDPAKGEILIKSPRVVVPEGRAVIVPWTEKLRYGKKKNGYHGGASPQEMLIPISFLWSDPNLPEGYEELAPDTPAWWFQSTKDVAVMDVEVETKPSKEPETLFEPSEEERAPRTLIPSWVDALFGSKIYRNQKDLAGRKAPPDAIVRKLIETLAINGGTMTSAALAVAIRTPPHRLTGMLAIVHRILNVDGYGVLERDEASDSIRLNADLLKTQFELD